MSNEVIRYDIYNFFFYENVKFRQFYEVNIAVSNLNLLFETNSVVFEIKFLKYFDKLKFILN